MRRLFQCGSLTMLLAACSPTATPPAMDAAADSAVRDTGREIGDAGEDANVVGAPLIDAHAWLPVEADADPFDDRPATVDCERGFGWDVELLDTVYTLGIQTGDCNYLEVSQPALRAVAPGETLAVQIWHFQLEGDGPAHIGIAIDGEVVWEHTVPIPSDSELITETFTVPAGAAEGAPVVFHLHNHGLNSWNLVDINTP